MTDTDFTVRNEGTIFLFTPVSDTAKDWAEDMFADAQTFGDSYVVEHRYARDIVEDLLNHAFDVTLER